MLLTNNEIDLSKSFDKFKRALEESKKEADKGGNIPYMNAYLNLALAAERHLKECADESVVPEADSNDLKHVNI